MGPTSRPSPRTFTDIGVSDVPLGVLVVKWLALLTVASHCVVLTVVTHPSAGVPSGQVHRHVKVARAGVFVAVTLCVTRPMSEKPFMCLPVEDGFGRKEANFRNWG